MFFGCFFLLLFARAPLFLFFIHILVDFAVFVFRIESIGRGGEMHENVNKSNRNIKMDIENNTTLLRSKMVVSPKCRRARLRIGLDVGNYRSVRTK
jgi:hypothetical protein